MPTRRIALFAVLALFAVPSSALAQSAGDDQYTNPVPQSQAPTSNGSGGGSGSGSGSGSGTTSGSPGTSTGTGSTTSTDDSSAAGTSSSDSGDTTTSSDDSGATLPRTGLPLGVLAALGLLFTFSGRRLRRASEDPAPDPYAAREADVPASSPVARAERRRSD